MFFKQSWLTRLLLFGLLISILSPVHADIGAEDNLQQWSMITAKGALKGKLLVYLEAQSRTTLAGPTTDNSNHFNTLLLRPALGYQLTKHISVWQGYGWTPTFNPEFRNEQRLWQQVLIENRFKHFTLTNRTRLEERFIDNAGGTAIRGRHMIRAAIPLGQSKWSTVAYDEGYINLNDTPYGPRSGFDQNRIFVGLNRKFNRHIDMEAGYLNQYINRKSPVRDRLNHALFIGLNFNL